MATQPRAKRLAALSTIYHVTYSPFLICRGRQEDAIVRVLGRMPKDNGTYHEVPKKIPPGGRKFTEKETQSSPVSILVFYYQSMITLNKQKANELTYEHLKGSMFSVL